MWNGNYLMKAISVIMSVHNGEQYLEEAVESVLGQNFKDFEFIIIDDASTDSTNKILSFFKDERIRLIKNNHNLGLTKSLNKALKLATGKYIARMDADDICYKERFEKQVHFLEFNKNIGICGSAISYIGDTKMISQPFPLTQDRIKIATLSYNPFAHPTVMWRRALFENFNFYYNEDYKTAQDYELWSRVVYSIDSANLEEKLLKYRVHTMQIGVEKKEQQDITARKIKLAQLLRLNLVPDSDEIIAHLCLFDDFFEKYREAKYVKKADEWMYKIILANKNYKIYNEELLLEYWESVFFGSSLYSYDLKIWRILKNSFCLKLCNISLYAQARQFIKCLLCRRVK